MTDKKLILGMALMGGDGALVNSWRAPQVDPDNFVNIEANIRYAQEAERGTFAFLFTPDFGSVRPDIATRGVINIIEPLTSLTAIARETSRIGLVSTGSTTFQEPYNTARLFKSLDVLSHGRVGWNAVTTSDPYVAANYGVQVPERSERYARADETIHIVQALWGSWEKDAWVKDKATGQYIDPAKLRPVNLQGTYVASRGPLGVPPSEQVQPVVFASGGPSPQLLAMAGRYASGFIGAVWTIEEARRTRDLVRQAAVAAGREPDEIKFFAGLFPTVTPTVREGLDRRIAIQGEHLDGLVPRLGAMLGIRIDPARIDEPLSAAQLAQARPTGDPRFEPALKVAQQGWSVRDILAHGVIDYHPVTVGPAAVHADHLQQWFEAGAADGFWVTPDVYEDGLTAFVDEVVPELQRRGIYPTDYPGATLRENLGVPEQYGLDPRVADLAGGR